MASLQGLPPLPKSLSGLISGLGSAQWKEMERIHAMRTMIQQDISRGHQPHHEEMISGDTSTTCIAGTGTDSWASTGPRGSSHAPVQGSSPHHAKVVRKVSTLDGQMALLRKEMVGLRQLDMSLLCQLWSLNESLLEYKQMLLQHEQQVVDDRSCPVSPTSASHVPIVWDNGYDRHIGADVSSSYDVDADGYTSRSSTGAAVRLRRRDDGDHRRSLHMLQEFDDDRLSVSSGSATESSKSSLEFGDI